MAKKLTAWKTKGMNRDVSVSAFNPEFAFENVNLRLSTNDSNTTLSWVNEKGPLRLKNTLDEDLSLAGIPIGTAVLDHKLVVFTTGASGTTPDHIYILKYAEDDNTRTKMEVEEYYAGNLHFNIEHPLETLVFYEAKHIQKVYWTDGLNQPRLINLEASDQQRKKWEISSGSGVQDFFFDFVPAIEFNEIATVEKNVSSAGIFAPGVIQYCFTYVNKYGQESNIVWCSSLYYLSYTDRGASPEDKVTNSFTIKIANPDMNFDIVRLYSIQRTSRNADAYVRHVMDFDITTWYDNVVGQYKPEAITYVDNGTAGSTVDPYKLLLIGGKEITAYTMADKDNTLFLGNLTRPNALVNDIQEYFDIQRSKDNYENPIHFVYDEGEIVEGNGLKTLKQDHAKGVYAYTSQLDRDSRSITTFKGGETYRFGFQLQKKTGEWTEPIFIDDATNLLYPSTSITSDYTRLAYATASIPLSTSGYNLRNYKRIRPVIVYPTIGERSVLCQGVLNPTVFNALDRIDSSPFAQASWYFRPYMVNLTKTTYNQSVPEAHPGGSESDANQDYFAVNDLATPMYITVAHVTKTAVLTRGYVTYQELWDWWYPNEGYTPHYPEQKKHYFVGAVKITDPNDPSTVLYALFSTSPWPKPVYQKDMIDEEHYVLHEIEYIDNVMPVGFTSDNTHTIKVYSGLKIDDMHMFYYMASDDPNAPDPYTLYFYVDEPSVRSYVVSFDAVTAAYNMITNNDDGSGLAYGHYQTLPNADGLTGTKADDPKDVEIQGSYGIITNPFSTYTKRETVNSNTQFFVDQSIVTMNSPEIDFDEEVQTYGTEGLRLRIVGAIPVTANISAHKITTSSAMLERNHNGASEVSYFGTGELSVNVAHKNIDICAGKRLVAEYLWNDVLVEPDSSQEDPNDKVKTGDNLYNYLTYPWHRNGSLNNDFRSSDMASSLLKTKKESNLLYSITTEYFNYDSFGSYDKYEDIGAQIHLQENGFIHNVRLPKQRSNSEDINYYPNIDKILYGDSDVWDNATGYSAITEPDSSSITVPKLNTPISMKYKSGSHAVIAFNSLNGYIPILPYGYDNIGQWNPSTGGDTYWGDKSMYFSQNKVDISGLFGGQTMNYLWIGELYKDVENRFGGTNKSAVRANTWLVGGESKNIQDIIGNNVVLNWTDGDTYYQRYDCLKTYAFTPEDSNQLIEILSFMCETHVNIDGRYDKFRGQLDNTNISPEIFNKLNPVYSQRDNFFTSKKYNHDDVNELVYPNQYWWSLTKIPGADVDEYTHITLEPTEYLDGDKGQITAIRKLNNQLVAFQDKGIAQILYNEQVQISTTEGVPIEIANSGKVQGKRYISDTVGCSNKWSMTTTPTGIYFMDSNDKSIYLFNGQLANLSLQYGFNTWSKQNIPAPEVLWNPSDFDNFIAYYDKLNQDVLFINDKTSLAFSERAGVFTSFYDYEGTPYLCNLDDTGIWICQNGSVYKHNAGEYGNFFGINKPYSTTFIGNPEPTTDKIFTNLEFRASVEDDGEYSENTGKFTPTLPFDSLETWDEYQHGIARLLNKDGREGMMHHINDSTAALKRKFRLWRCDIPRDNAPVNSLVEKPMGIKRFRTRPMDRMRNPWIYLKLTKDAAANGSVLNKTEIHDLIMTYYS